jgi:hypothetical protein
MKVRNITVFTAILGAAVAGAQTGTPSAASRMGANQRSVIATNNASGLAENVRSQSAMHLRVEEMGSTLSRMHALLKQMQAKAAASSTKDPIAKANLEMWGLMLADLDKQYEQLSQASRARADIESRRAAMYKQAEAKAAAEAQMRGQGAHTQSPADDKSNSGAATPSAGEAPAAHAPAPASPPTSPK